MAIVSLDDTPIVKFSNPPQNAIVQPIAATTAGAARLLIRAKAGDEELTAAVTNPSDLTVRRSTAATAKSPQTAALRVAAEGPSSSTVRALSSPRSRAFLP